MPRRVAQANAWIREASDQSRMNVQDGTGMADAQYAVGAFYYAGLGVPQDYIRAYFWFSLAVVHWPKLDKGAYDGLIYSRDSAAAKLTPQQLAYSQKLVSEWRAK